MIPKDKESNIYSVVKAAFNRAHASVGRMDGEHTSEMSSISAEYDSQGLSCDRGNNVAPVDEYTEVSDGDHTAHAEDLANYEQAYNEAGAQGG